jgi:single-strand DNA-binding protein
MQGINKVILMGRLGRDPELRQTGQGKALCRFSIATNRSWRQGDSWQEQTDWHDVVLWDEQGERAARLLSRGDICAVEGRLTARSWEDAEGQRRRKVEVVASRFQLVSRTGAGREASSAPRDAGREARSVVAMPEGVNAQ